MAPAQTSSPPCSPGLQPGPFQVAFHASPREMFLKLLPHLLYILLWLPMAPGGTYVGLPSGLAKDQGKTHGCSLKTASAQRVGFP